MWTWRTAAVGLMATVLAGCHDDAAAQRSASASVHSRAQTGFASYYGRGFHGERTASGEVFDQNELVAAHPSMEFGTVLRVTNLENGRSVVVRVIDRGPFGRNRRKGVVIDLSEGAARRLQFIGDGIVRVRLQILWRPAAGSRAGPRTGGV